MVRYPEVRAALQNRKAALPIITVEGEIRFTTTFTPTDVVSLVGRRLRQKALGKK